MHLYGLVGLDEARGRDEAYKEMIVDILGNRRRRVEVNTVGTESKDVTHAAQKQGMRRRGAT